LQVVSWNGWDSDGLDVFALAEDAELGLGVTRGEGWRTGRILSDLADTSILSIIVAG
jgi:hypothetical protein